MAETLGTLKTIERDELKQLIDRREPLVLLETLSPEHFRNVHLPGALNAPPERIKELAPVLIPHKHTQVITYCAGPTCHASSNAARELAALGYTNVRHYPGGKLDWTTAGLPVERGAEETRVAR
jgi:rhodanese-related sulfurtransferase